MRVVKVIPKSKFYEVLDFYLNGQKKLIGKSRSIVPASFEDTCISYYPNGNTERIAIYKNDTIIGPELFYFPNGTLCTVKQYSPPDKTHTDQNQNPIQYVLIKTCNDSTGKALVINGDGHYIAYDKNAGIAEEGEVKDGKKAGEWKGTYEKEHMTFTEVYDNGELRSGTSVDSTGAHHYMFRSIYAQFNGGVNGLYKYLSHDIRYPAVARENNVQGKVVLGITIAHDGKVTHIKVLQSVSPEIDLEAARVVNLSPRWSPTISFGRITDQYYILPISFNLVGNR